MPRKISDPQPPKGLKRLMFRAPIWLYNIGLGSLLGGRFLLLNHTGRKSGQPRQTVLEVVNFDPSTGTYYIASGFGKKSDWYLNIKKTPEVEIQVGSKTMPVTAHVLEADESGKRMVDYARRHPHAAKELMRICGYEVDGSTEDYFTMGHDFISIVSLSPR
ncbi:MAG: nitroreductase family deazaflavin-dependent oxidoreductase [Candidatus Promineifilaceae bacterium]